MQMVCTEVIHTVGNRTVERGAFVDSKDKVVKNCRSAFVTVEEWAAEHGGPPVVEQATAAPGETRAIKKPASKSEAKRVEIQKAAKD
jgi:hypothetical protein